MYLLVFMIINNHIFYAGIDGIFYIGADIFYIIVLMENHCNENIGVMIQFRFGSPQCECIRRKLNIHHNYLSQQSFGDFLTCLMYDRPLVSRRLFPKVR